MITYTQIAVILVGAYTIRLFINLIDRALRRRRYHKIVTNTPLSRQEKWQIDIKISEIESNIRIRTKNDRFKFLGDVSDIYNMQFDNRQRLMHAVYDLEDMIVDVLKEDPCSRISYRDLCDLVKPRRHK